jgi:hypothetical protein
VDEVTDGRTEAWWPAIRRIDVIGFVLILVTIAWVWWASGRSGGDGGALIGLLVLLAVVAALARWATFFHGTGPAAALAIVLLGYGLLVGEGNDSGGPERLGALLSVGAGAAAVVALRATRLWLKLTGGAAMLVLALLTWRSDSIPAILLVAIVVISTLALLGLPMRERRWVIVWPGLVAVLVLLGSATYASLGLPADRALGSIMPDRVAAWDVALDTATEEPLTGIGLGAVPPDATVDEAGGWAMHEPLQLAAELGLPGALLIIILLWWTLVWVARPGGGPGSVIAGVVIAGSVAHACVAPIWRSPAVPIALAVLAGAASMRGGDARWRLEALVASVRDGGPSTDGGSRHRETPRPSDTSPDGRADGTATPRPS